MSPRPLVEQLRLLRAQLALDAERHELRVAIAAGLRDVRRIANAPDAEPLPQLLARLAQGHVTTDAVGSAISRDGALASQVAQAAGIDFGNAQVGDVRVSDVAGGNIYHIYYGGDPHEQRDRDREL